MSQRVFRITALPTLTALILAGCSLAPKYERPVAPVPAQYPSYAEAVQSGEHAVPASADLGWREFFLDPQLQALIGVALQNNRDLRIAVERIQEARAQYGIQQSERLPTFGAGGTAQVTRNPEGLRMGGPDSPSVSRVYQAGVGITAFELDFFGRIRNLTEAAFQQFLATEEARRTVHISLVAQVAEAYFSLRAAEQQLELARRTLAARQASFDIVQRRFDAGVAGALDLNQAKGQLDTVRADIAELTRLEAQAQNAMLLLLGQQPPADLPTSEPFGKDQLLASIPVGLPSDLLTRRPDIIAAEHALMGANANIGAARAAFFPNISITGLLGFASGQLGGLFSSGNRYWTYSPQLTIPLFSGGVSGNLDLAEARKNIAVAQYEKAIQVAFREVADTLAGEATYASQLDALRSLEQSTAQTLDIAKLRYEEGIDSFLQVQTAEVGLYSAQRQFLQTGLNSLLNRVELYKALGGGWVEHTPVAADAQGGPATGVSNGAEQ
ncbi:efflux transporter outer membrane subunit [Pusillimonas sp.]|uniref:efflux transporter outer membrane subunit n=1 Tax=Pusillimonas sp. TaxID=3040095 RepID=UPI0037CBD189